LKLGFESANLLANGALRDRVHDGRLGKTPSFGQIAKDFERVDIHNEAHEWNKTP
jgi:hypothetical protein